MKKLFALLVLACGICSDVSAQEKLNQLSVSEILEAQYRGESIAVRDWDYSKQFNNEVTKTEKLGYHPKGDWPLHDAINPDALPQGDDPAWQKEKPLHTLNSAKLEQLNMNGMGYTFVNPSDNILDVGPNHVIQMINSSSGAKFQIYDKSGNTLAGPLLFDNFFGFGSGLGDPIVLYDALADRWFMAEFTSESNDFNIAVSRTPDPLGMYSLYTFTAPNFPDYLKFGVWSDMYIMTSNESGPSAVYALDRLSMLQGIPASMQRFTVPDYPTIGFQATTPVTFDIGNAPPIGAPGMFMRMADDAWSTSIANDRLEIWSMDIDFGNADNSVVSGPFFLNTEPFDTELCGYTAFACFQQPGTSTKLDPLREVLMNRVQYKNFGTHEAIVCNHVTDVDGSDRGGVRWYELRRNGGIASPWGIHQQGTYSPDSDSRFMAGIAMNEVGDISIFYNVTSSSTFPGIRYTGRYAGDPLGQMTLAEAHIKEGAASNGSNRYGDYNSLDVDPSDVITFWGTANYNQTSSWSTRIAAYSFSALNCDAPVVTTTISENCVSGTFEVLVNIGNEGDATSYSLTSFGTDTTYQGGLAPGNYILGPFAIGEVISVLVEHADDPTCNRSISGLTADGTSCCDAPTVDVTTTPDCEAGIFNILLDIGSDGDASEYNVYTSVNGVELFTGSYQSALVDLGEFALGSMVDVRVEHSEFEYCDQTITGITVTSICNDDCAGAIPVICGTAVSGTTVGASAESPDPGLCGTSAGSGGGIWYVLTGVNSNDPNAPSGSLGDDVTLSLCSENGSVGSANYDSKIRVFSGSCGALSCVVGDDDACTGTTSLVNFATQVDEVYYILVHGYTSAEGDFVMDIRCSSPPPPPDYCNGTAFTDSGSDTGSYQNNELETYTICPDVDGQNVTVTFDFVDIETSPTSNGVQNGCYDFLTIYDGPSADSPVLAQTLCGELDGSGDLPSVASSLLQAGDSFTASNGCLTFVFDSDGSVTEPGWSATVDCGTLEDNCSVFDSAPVDLNKSFQPVPYPNGDIDRVQLKFYKASPEVKYTAIDNAALDIEFWPIRDLVTNTPITDGDTSLIADKVKPGQDFFKWPVKFIRPDIHPNTRYVWRLRTKCQEGDLRISPWSELKIFNTPGFDPETGIYIPGLEVFSNLDESKSLVHLDSMTIFPNPNGGESLNIILNDGQLKEVMSYVEVSDMTGKQLFADHMMIKNGELGAQIQFEPTLTSGMYFLTLEVIGKVYRTRFLVQ